MDQDEPRGEVVAAGATREKKGNPFSRFFGGIALFIRQVIAELRKVVTPTRKAVQVHPGGARLRSDRHGHRPYGLDTLFAFLTHWVFGIPG